jgi:uncharacterized protein (DUF1330 family)
MATYVIAGVTVKNPEVYAEYRSQVLATITKNGGRSLVRVGASQVIEGGLQPGRVVVIEFPDMAAAQAWNGSKEYGPLVKLRQSASTGSLLFIEGACPSHDLEGRLRCVGGQSPPRASPSDRVNEGAAARSLVSSVMSLEPRLCATDRNRASYADTPSCWAMRNDCRCGG